MSLDTVLNRWKYDPSLAPHIAAWQVIPGRDPVFENFPQDLEPQLAALLRQHGIHALYRHQLEVWQQVQAGNNVLLTTGTASGKTLSYNLPALNRLHKNKLSRALYLFPTKALAHDQLSLLESFNLVSAAAYDGDTPKNQRQLIRQNAQLVVSNPDMLHLGILPFHIQWGEFFSNLDYIVLDEIHVYRGVFGSHVANVIRRLKRITAHYGSSPRFILTSATIGNPLDLAQSLIEEKAVLIDKDYSARGKKHFLVYNPPVIDQQLGLRASMQGECIRLAADLIQNDCQTILFGRSRRSVEFMVAELRKTLSLDDRSIRSYRSGYLASHRRVVESGLKSGRIRGVTATTALELGMDIGGLDAAILAGYPGTISGTWQQAGRSGRKEDRSLALLVTSSSPLDQYLAQHPEFFFSANPETGLIDPDNLLIAVKHIMCAAYELPFEENSTYGSFSANQTGEILAYLEQSGTLLHSSGSYYWASGLYPASDISLRTASSDQITLRCIFPGSVPGVIGVIDKASSYWMVHPGAVYLHEGESYLVEELDLAQNIATLIPSAPDYYTEPERQSNFSVIELKQEKGLAGSALFLGDIAVTSQVTGYKIFSRDPYKILGREPLELPVTTLSTAGTWLTLSNSLEDQLRSENLWSSSANDYGPKWNQIRTIVLQRDQNTCQICHQKGDLKTLHVHHKMPIRIFSDLREANQLSNLISLCPRCHQRAESAVRVNSGIWGLGYVLHHLAPLLLMSDPGDIGLYTDFQSPLGDKRPLVLLYEFTPGGIGFSKALFNLFGDLLYWSCDLVKKCPCQDGCPSCVGPGGQSGSGGKAETQALLDVLTR